MQKISKVSQTPVGVAACDNYEAALLDKTLAELAMKIGLSDADIRGKRVVIKPNLVSAMSPDRAATTHPGILQAAVRLLRRMGAASICVAESPGGPFTVGALRRIYTSCGILAAAEECGVELNYDTSFSGMQAPEGRVCQHFNVINAIQNADVIVNLCKLKTHSLTFLSCAEKNFFGCIPGVQKFEMHAAYPDPKKFAAMIVDLTYELYRQKTLISLCDGIVGMEGNGPTGGIPRKFGCLLMSASPFCLDLAAESILGMEGEVPMIREAADRGLCPEKAENLILVGAPLDSLRVPDIHRPDSANHKSAMKFALTLGNGRFAYLFEIRPQVVRRRCVGCGICAASCPQHTITVDRTRKRPVAKIDSTRCIRCYCCQELCPHHAVKTHVNPIVRLVK